MQIHYHIVERENNELFRVVSALYVIILYLQTTNDLIDL